MYLLPILATPPSLWLKPVWPESIATPELAVAQSPSRWHDNSPEQSLCHVLMDACMASSCTRYEACTVLAVHVSVHQGVPIAAPKVWYSKVRLVTSDREESALH